MPENEEPTFEPDGEDVFASSSFTPAPPPSKANGHDTTTPQPNGHDHSDPFAASNFNAPDMGLESAIDEANLDFGPPDDEGFVRVSPDPKHTALITCLVTSREEGFGKTYSLLTPVMKGWAAKQPSLAKFVKTLRVFLYQTQDYTYGLWPARDALDAWAISELQVINAAKEKWVRRYAAGKQRKGHPAPDGSIDAEVQFPTAGMFTSPDGSPGLLARAFGEAFVITSPDHPILKKLLR